MFIRSFRTEAADFFCQEPVGFFVGVIHFQAFVPSRFEAGEEGNGGFVEKVFGGAEGGGLPAVVVQVFSSVHADNVSGNKAALHHEAADEGIGLSLLYIQEAPDFLDADAAVLGQVFQYLSLGLVGPVFGLRLPVVSQLPVPFNGGEGRLAAQQEFPVGYLSALDAGNFPVPGCMGKVFLRVKPKLRGRHFLDGIAGDAVLEKGDDTQLPDGSKHGFLLH